MRPSTLTLGIGILSGLTTAQTLTVDPNGGVYTAIAQGIATAQAQAIPTVYVKAGTYAENVTISNVAAVTVIGETANSEDYNSNLVTISASGAALTIGTTSTKGTVWKNINFVNTVAKGNNAYALTLVGKNHAFYNCQVVSAGNQAVFSNKAVAFISGSYIEGYHQVFSSFHSTYVYNSVITATNPSSALLAYTKGSGVINSMLVFDSCTVTAKTGSTATNVYLAAPIANGSQVLYRDTYLGSFISPAGVHPSSGTASVSGNLYYGEYNTSGPGAYAAQANYRAPQDILMTSTQAAAFNIDKLMANSFYPTTDLSWIDPTILAAIQGKYATTVGTSSSSSSSSSTASSSSVSSTIPTLCSISSSASSVSSFESSSFSTSQVLSSTVSSVSSPSPSVSSSETLSSTSVGSTADSSSLSTISTTLSSSLSSLSLTAESTSVSTSSSSSASPSSTCIPYTLPSSIPSAANVKVVGPSGSCANYTSLVTAAADLPLDGKTWYVYILAGTYTGQVIVPNGRSGATIFRGESSSPLDQTVNQVTITNGFGALNSGSTELTSTFWTSQWYAKGLAFYNINFVNTYTPSKNYVAIAMDIKAQNVGFYSCGFKSSMGTVLANTGNFFFAGCRIEGGQDLFWGYGAAYVYNSQIVTNAAGYSIAAQSYQTKTGPNSQFVFDTCSIVPTSASIGKESTYLGRDYSTSARVAYINSYMDTHIMGEGWYLGSTGSTVYNTTFVESNNTGPGADVSKRTGAITAATDLSAFSLANTLVTTSFIDTAAIPPFAGFPDSVFGSAVSSSSSDMSSTQVSTISTTATTTTTSVVSTTSATACPTDTLTVKQIPDDSCQYPNITAALLAIPADGKAKTVLIFPGDYNEKLSLNRTGKVSLIGKTDYPNDFSQNQVSVWNSYGVSTSEGRNEQTPTFFSKKSDLAVYNINFQNKFGNTYNFAALAGDFYGSNMAFYGCSFKGYQDTLLLNKGVQVLSNCYIEGSVDFIWGYSTAFLRGCYIAANTPGTSICAHNGGTSTTSGGYVIDSSYVTYTQSYGTVMQQTYLGRPWSNHSRVIYQNSYLDQHIAPAGWSIWSTSSPQTEAVTFAEYNNTGPGSVSGSSKRANVRASFSSQLTADQAAQYTLANYIGDTSWIDMDTFNLKPSYQSYIDGTTSGTPTTGNSTATASAVASVSATASSTCGHPTSGTEIPAGAVVVDGSNSTTGAYSNLSAALAALPKDTTCQTVFIMPGTYVEQANVNRPGQTRVIGYTTDAPGKGYSGNQVTISFARGLSVVPPIPSGSTNAQTAVITTTSSNIGFYNVNFINTANLDGAQSSFVTLAASVYGSHIGFYGCSFVGWQDTLLTGQTNGYHYYESCYIEGAIDFIWGYSLSYFKGCTVAAKRKNSCIAAHSRSSSSAIGGYIFDQCLITAASGYETALQGLVYLGRPYSQYSRVVYKNSYLTNVVQPAGWKVWSTTDQRTDNIVFAEFNNSGPGNWESNAAARLSFQNATLLSSDTYTLSSVMDSTSWIDMTYWDSISIPATPTTTTTPTPSASSTSVVTVANSTWPADDDYVVSKSPIAGKTVYSSISAALTDMALVSSSKTVTVFIFPGTYEEELRYNRSGTTIFRGYSETPDDNTKNQVIVKTSHGVDTGADVSNSDSATFYSRAKFAQIYNINFNNVFGTTQDYASLGFAAGNNGYVSFYGCQITGNQDTFNFNSGTSIFVYNSLVEGSIDFIYGAGSAYFLKSTLVPNTNGGCITAHKRNTNTTAAGVVFDKCTVASKSTVSAGTIYLGRPWNQYARVAWISSYLDSSINSAGWSVWSKSSPQTDGVIFGEYLNDGPGAAGTRASFSKQLSDTEAADFQLANFFSQTTSWINMTYVNTLPFVVGSVATPSLIPTASSTLSSSAEPTTTALLTIYTGKPTTITLTVPGATVTASKFSTAKLTVTQSADVVTTTKTTVAKITFTTTSSQSDVTKFSTVLTTVGSSVTITPPVSTITKYSTLSTQVGSIRTITPDVVVSTKFETISTTIGTTSTVVPAPTTVVVSQTTTQTVLTTSTKAPATQTLSQTSTISQTVTSTPAVRTISSTSLFTYTTTSVSSPKAVTTTSTVSTHSVPGKTVTSTPKAVTSKVTSLSTVSKTVKTTTTLACSPVAKIKRGALEFEAGFDVNRFNVRALVTSTVRITTLYTAATVTATGPPTSITQTYIVTSTALKTDKASTVTEYQTLTSTVKTSTLVIPGVTTTSTSTSTAFIGGTTTLKQSSITVTSTVVSTSVISGSTTLKASSTTISSTKTSTFSISATTTLKQATVFSTSTRTISSTQVLTTTLPAVTSTVYRTVTIVQTSTLPSQTRTVVVSRSETRTVTSQAAAQTIVVTKVLTTTGAPSTVTLGARTVLKTTAVKTTHFVTSTVTKVAKHAPTCGA